MRALIALALLAAIPARAEEFQMPPLPDFAAVTERPLFAPDRRPHEAPPQIAGSAGPIALTGIVIEQQKRYALINEGAPLPRRIAEGERLAVGTVKQILPDRIVIAAAGGGETVIKLFDRKAAAVANPAAPPMPAPPSRIMGR